MAVPRLRVEVDYEQLKKAGVDIKQVFGQIGVGADVVEKKMRNTEKALKSQERQFHALKASLDPVFAAQQRYQRQVQLLDDALRRGLIKSQDEHNRLLTVARQKYSDAATGAGGFARKVSGELASMATSYLGVAAAIGVFTRALSGSISEAIEAERAYSRLEFTVTRNAERIGFSADELARFAGQLQSATAFDDEAIMGAMEALSRFSSVNGSNIQELTKLTLDYAAATGKDAVAAAQALGKALDEPGESLRALKDVGVVLNRVEEEQIDLLMKAGMEWEAQAIIFRRIREAVSGEAANELKAYEGQWKQLKNAIGEVGERLGDFLIKISLAYAQSTGFIRHWAKAGEMPQTQVRTVPLERFGTAQNTGLIDERKMEEASRSVIRALDDEGKAAERSAEAIKKRGEAWAEHIEKQEEAFSEKRWENYFSNLEKLDALAKKFFATDLERLEAIARTKAAKDAAAYIDLGKLREELSWEERRFQATLQGADALREWAIAKAKADYMATTNATPQMVADFEAAQRALIGVVEKTAKLGETWDEISADIQENFIRGVQDTFAGAIEQILTTGKVSFEDLWKTVFKLFAQMIAQMIVKWIFLEKTKTAITAKEAAKRGAIDSVSGDGESGEGLSSLSKYASWFSKIKAWYQGGGSSTIGTWGGIAVAALTVAAALYNQNKRRQHEEGGRRETSASVMMQGGDFYGYSTGRLQQTGNAIATGMADLFRALNETARAGITSIENVTIDISNNKKYFDAKVGDAFLGHFKSAEEAMIAAVGRAFSTAEGDIDEVLRASMQNFSGKSIEDMKKAAEMIQEVADAFNGVSEVDVAIGEVIPKARQLAEELRALGVAAIDAGVTAARSAVVGFRGIWESLSGATLSPKEERERAERSRALLLAQMKLEREKLAGEIRILQLRGRLAQGQFDLNKAELRGETLFLVYQGKLYDAELDMASGYLRGRGEFVKTEVNLFNAELDAMQAVLVELDKLIAEVTAGDIRIRGGRGRGGRGGGGQSYQDRLISALERLINAVTALREFQQSLKQDEQLSPYSAQRRFFMARAAFTNLSQQAMAGNVSAIEQLPEAARLYLELAQQMFGRAGAGYGNIFEQVQAILQAISDQYPEGQDPQAWLRSDMEAVNRYLESLNLDGRRRREQHDETNRRLRDIHTAIEAGNQQGQNNGVVMNRLLATRKVGEQRNDGKRAA